MDDMEREKKLGFDWDYMMDIPAQKEAVKDQYQIAGFGLAAALFSFTAKGILEAMGPERGEALLIRAIQDFGRARGKRIASLVSGLGKPLTFKNWLIYGDLDARNFDPHPDLDNGDLVVKAGACTFWNGAKAFGLGDFARYYCRHVDYAILEGYNPEVKLILEDRHDSGKDHCVFRYIMKEANK